jgi:RNA polymerase sigma factor (sigma-70 family)
MNDWELVRQYVMQESETAFSALVTRHVDLVYLSAMRQVHDSRLAEEITQTVFILMARKARTFRENIVLPGWLYRTARFVGATALRSEHRRRQREREALQMQQNASSDETWRRLAPVLDEALEQLGEGERNAVVLRFFQERPLREVGNLLGISEEAARKRVDRSVEKLRVIFARRGFSVAAGALATALSVQGAEAVPAGLGGRVAPRAFAHGQAMTSALPELAEKTLGAWRRTRVKVVLALSIAGVLTCLLVLCYATWSPQRPPRLPLGAAALDVAHDPPVSPAPEHPPSLAAETPKTGGLRFQGSTEHRAFHISGEVLVGHHELFTLDLDRSGKWTMVTSTTGIDDTNACLVAAFDGTNTFHIAYVTRTHLYSGSAEMTEAVPYKQGLHYAQVSRGAYPFDVFVGERFTWLALASGYYVSRPESKRMPAPWRDGRNDILAYAYTNDIRGASAWPNAPLGAEFLTNPSLLDGELPDLMPPKNVVGVICGKERQGPFTIRVSSNLFDLVVRGHETEPWAAQVDTNLIDPRFQRVSTSGEHGTGGEQGKRLPPMRPGQLAALYSVQAWTNFSGALIPLDYKLEVFRSASEPDADSRYTREVFIGHIASIAPIDSSSGRPAIWGSLTVDDYRHPDDPAAALNGHLHYRIADGAWKE